MKDVQSTLHRIPNRSFQPLYISQLSGEHYRGDFITNDASLQHDKVRSSDRSCDFFQCNPAAVDNEIVQDTLSLMET